MIFLVSFYGSDWCVQSCKMVSSIHGGEFCSMAFCFLSSRVLSLFVARVLAWTLCIHSLLMKIGSVVPRWNVGKRIIEYYGRGL